MTDPVHEEFESVPCNLCGEKENIETLAEKGQHGLPAHVVICRNCGLLYLSPRWSKERYLHFYREEYDKYYRPYLVKSPPVSAKKASAPAAVIIPAIDRMKAAGLLPGEFHQVLDVGSGSGGFLNLFHLLYPSAERFAIEPSANCIPVLEKNRIRHIASDVDSDWEITNRGKFDFIHMRHVLEHFQDPLEVLKKAKEALTPDGLLYVCVPDSLHPGLPLIDFYFRVVHTYYFNRHTLAALMQRAGLTPVMVVEGDKFDRHEIAILAKKGVAAEAVTNVYQQQLNVFMPFIRHERSLPYRFRQWLRNLFRRAQPVTD